MLFIISSLDAVNAPIPARNDISFDKIYGVDFQNKIDIDDFIKMNIKQLEKKRGKKLKLKEKIALKIAKTRLKKLRKKGAPNSDLSEEAKKNFYFLPFLMGFFLIIFGVLFTWAIWNDRKKTISAWLGFGVLLFIMFLFDAW